METNIESIISNINEITKSLDTNTFIKKARESFKENIQDYEVADDEKAKMIATYEAQVSAGIISEIMQLAKEMPEIIAREKNILKDVDVKAEQIKVATEQVNELKARTKNIEEDTKLKEENKKIATEQIKTEKGKTLLIAEQIVSEKYRHRDLRSSISVKNASIEVTKQQAKFEEARRYIAIEANHQNVYMKKADFKVQNLQAIATDDDITISAEQMTDSKETIDDIPVKKIDYTTEVAVAKPNIEDEIIQSNPIS